MHLPHILQLLAVQSHQYHKESRNPGKKTEQCLALAYIILLTCKFKPICHAYLKQNGAYSRKTSFQNATSFIGRFPSPPVGKNISFHELPLPAPAFLMVSIFSVLNLGCVFV